MLHNPRHILSFFRNKIYILKTLYLTKAIKAINSHKKPDTKFI